jgi:hypothetical protein
VITTLSVFFSYIGFSQKDCDHNPYQHQREEYIQTGREIFNSYKDINCKEVEELIKTAKEIYYSDQSLASKRDAIGQLGKVNCQVVVDFFIDIVIKESSEQIRYDAIQYLGWIRAKSSIPFLLDFVKKDISKEEKFKIALSLCVMEEYDLAIQIISPFCYDHDGFVLEECIHIYEFAGKTEDAKKYYERYFENADKDHLLFVACKLAEYGNHEKAYPILIDALNSGDQEKMHSALFGLATIGDEKAFQLIQEQTKSKNNFIAQRSQFILNYIKRERERRQK